MSEQLMREQFEAWVLREYPNQIMAKFSDGDYQSWALQHCWVGWRASREAFAVDLPSASAYEGLTHHLGCAIELTYEKPEHDPVALVRLPDVVAAIEACGLKVKP
ncbi:MULTISPECIES: hypothetical protein [Pseudomonas]|uniref:Transposase n=1 Tax=Pseudomonas putida S13.1.2 TaxID=1384061 RepID=A0AAU8S0M9_PSEPU|nr:MULTISPECIES: hypothetical protein [Pseudomonas]AJQ46412.1 hypothetical protein N805_03910 [Pseudomonas putida S13.1.2]